MPQGSTPTSINLNTHSSHTGLVKAVVLAGLWPRVARVHLPPGAIKFDRVQAGSIQRANEAKEYKFYDIRAGDAGGRVFLHPASILFHSAEWKSPFVAYFQKQSTTKVFLRDATEVRLFNSVREAWHLMDHGRRFQSTLYCCSAVLSLSTTSVEA